MNKKSKKKYKKYVYLVAIVSGKNQGIFGFTSAHKRSRYIMELRDTYPGKEFEYYTARDVIK